MPLDKMSKPESKPKQPGEQQTKRQCRYAPMNLGMQVDFEIRLKKEEDPYPDGEIRQVRSFQGRSAFRSL